jgi:hypothetical protein
MADSRVADLWYSDEKKSKRGVIIDKEEVRRAWVGALLLAASYNNNCLHTGEKKIARY